MTSIIKIESNSMELDIYSNKNTYQEKNRTKFLSKKIEKEKKEKILEIKKDCPNFFENENMNLPLCEEEMYFDKDFINAKFNEYIKEMNPENHELAKRKINSEETMQLKFDYSLQKSSEDSYSLSDSPKMDKDTMPSSNEMRRIIFPNNPKNESDSPSSGMSSNETKQSESKTFLQKKRGKEKIARKYNRDNIRIKLKRRFCRYLISKLNAILKNSGCINYFDFFPNKFASDIKKERINKILNMSLKDIFLDENLYINEDKDGKEKYEHNSNVVKSDEIKNNEKLQNILNKTFSQLYQDYINSDEFKVNEINRLKRDKKQDSDYIERFTFIAGLGYFYCQ